MSEIQLPFSMQAEISVGAARVAEPDDDPLPPGWVRIPVSFQITLPAGLMDRAAAGQAAMTPPSGSNR